MIELLDQDSLDAGLDLIGRTGARDLVIGFVHDDVPPDQAGWYATASYKGAKVISEDHKGPVEAVEALARRLLTGAKCTHCEGLIALSDHGALFYAGATMADGSTFTEQQARNRPHCRYRRVGNRWVRGCSLPPNRAARRQAGRRRGA